MHRSPEAPYLHQIKIQLQASDFDELDHVNNVIYLNWVQKAAGSHWQTVAPESYRKKVYWVVLRHEIDYRKPILAGEIIAARTWVEEMRGVRSVRKVEIFSDTEIKARATTTWVMMDASSQRPMRINAELTELFLKS